MPIFDWKYKEIISNYRLLQYDILFGENYIEEYKEQRFE